MKIAKPEMIEVGEWSQKLQRAFEVAQETHDLYDVFMDRGNDKNVNIHADDPEQVERMYSFLVNSRVL